MLLVEKVLIVEDSQIVVKILKHIARQELVFDVLLATTFAEARQYCEQHQGNIFAAVIDLNLPDAPDGEVVDYTLEQKIPTIVLTGSFDEKRRESLLSKGIVDYVTKEGRYSYQYAIRSINRLYTNQNIKVLVVEDSTTMRKYIVNLLSRHKFQILQAVDGVDAIKVFLENPDIKLLITDYNMPNMDGFELVKNLRCKYEKFDLVIIGLSAEGESNLSAKLIKTGANDFLTKPFNHEEFYCRINHNVESLHLIDQIRDAANRDYLTNIYSRCYFFAASEQPYETAKQQQSPLALAQISLDNFSNINDSYGQAFGDKVLADFSKDLEKLMDKFLVARAVGKEFYVLMPGLSNDKAFAFLDQVKTVLSGNTYGDQKNTISLTFSAGVSNLLGEHINDQINAAKDNLHRAKEAGKNIVLGDDVESDY
ncbi:diguanylate cyclase response regulator [Candidatus Endobugula sertula]|uniref:Diguanylate cyclase response regulator n=1 Tax=Candidatus Endobugula sertula TaxID=62101 RepID=A0A1D2QMV8_9GAMM|nr:diguanylate cyclase response regulator [Candidatus Endobugula sertula]